MPQRLIKGVLTPALTLAVILGVVGCGKKAAPPTVSQPAPAETPPQPAPAPQQSQPTVQSTDKPNEPDLAAINRLLIRWMVGHKKRPATFEEFAATAGAPIPPPPPGKKYVLGANSPKIQLVNQ